MLLLAACQRAPDPAAAPAAPPRAVAPVLATAESRDIHSRAEPAVARVTHVDFDLRADFTARTLSGRATLEVQVPAGVAAPVLTLDTRDLTILAVDDAAGQPLDWTLGAADAVLGRPLSVPLGAVRQVTVRYVTAPGAGALQWLEPAQTAGRASPYLFSQGQAILTRTWLPTQDSPGIRQTWTGRIVTPASLRAVMSGEMLNEAGEPDGDGLAWRFRMDQPVAPYLIAMAIGDLAQESVGARTAVYAERPVLASAAAELADLEPLVAAAERLYGPYRWGRYDVLVLPPSFPFGGMENPRLTFATPTILAGDKSLVGLIAHELAHSWSGNLVTNATWADFWLNEGFTTYIENRVMEEVYGAPVAAMLADLGWDDLQATLADLGAQSPDTRLHIDLAGRDPDDGVTSIPYEKGATFLRTIEAAVGRKRWDAYLRGYFDRHAFAPQTTAGFLADLRANLVKDDPALESSLALDEWAYGTGLPANAVHVRSERLAAIDSAAVAFAARGADVLEGSEGWHSAERVRFLNRLPRRLPVARLRELDSRLALSTQGNSEVRFAWLRLAVANRHDAAKPSLAAFLTGIGRRKFIVPLYTDLLGQGAWGRPLATGIYAEARPGYHPVAVATLDRLFAAKP